MKPKPTNNRLRPNRLRLNSRNLNQRNQYSRHPNQPRNSHSALVQGGLENSVPLLTLSSGRDKGQWGLGRGFYVLYVLPITNYPLPISKNPIAKRLLLRTMLRKSDVGASCAS
jgi:hypothetical protein